MYRSNLLERMYTSIDIKAGNGASSSGRRPLQGISQYECAVLIGHRGLKMNHRPDESVRENTVHSLREAYTSGAAYVEFDVQVTSDGVPVLWHDDQVVTMVDGDKVFQEISQLSLEAFRTLTTGHPVEFGGRLHQLVRYPGFHCQDGQPTRDPMPWTCQGDASGKSATLQEAFEQAPPELGFNIELKFDSKRVSSAEERAFHLLNTLRVVKDFAADRPILFSSFDVDACLEVRSLQEQYPVFMLTCMEKAHPDPRRRSLNAAVAVTLTFGLDGIVADNAHLFKELAQVERLRKAGLPLFSYGPANCNAVTVSMQIAAGVSGIITDDLGVCMSTISVLDGFTTQEAKKIELEPVENDFLEFSVDVARPMLVAV